MVLSYSQKLDVSPKIFPNIIQIVVSSSNAKAARLIEKFHPSLAMEPKRKHGEADSRQMDVREKFWWHCEKAFRMESL